MLLFGLAGVIAAGLAGWAVARNGLRPGAPAHPGRRGDRPHRAS